MLKMIKYELTGSFRQYLLGFTVYLVACIMVPWIPIEFLKNIGVMSVALLMFGLMIILGYNVVAYYQRSMFKRQGYLTLTLPVSEEVLVLSKLMSTLVWLIVSTVILMAGFFIFALGVGDLSWANMIEGFSMIGKYLSQHTSEVLQDIFCSFCGFAASVMYIYFVITLVHTHWIKKHRAIAGIGIYLVSSVGFSYLLDMVPFSPQLWTIAACSLLAIVLFYMGTVYLIKKHIELE